MSEKLKKGDVVAINAHIQGCPVGTKVEITGVRHNGKKIANKGVLYDVKAMGKEFLVWSSQISN